MNRWVEHHLGTAITIAADGPERAAVRFFGRVAELESMLSRFRPDSPLSLVASGDLPFDDAPAEVRTVLTECERLLLATRGDFDHRPRNRSGCPTDPVLDPNAFAKGWIIEQACLELRLAGVRRFFVNAGGDVVVGDAPLGRSGWRVGVRDPFVADEVRATFDLAGAAVATSGRYERGDHIRRVCAAGGLASVTVLGPELGTADALATAVFASGSAVPSWWDHEGDYSVLAIADDGRLRWTGGLERHGFAFTPAAA